MSTKLKPCPFCGGEASLKIAYGRGVWYVMCGSCGAKTNEFTGYGKRAIEMWNRRVQETTVIQNGENNTHIDHVDTLNM